MFQHFPEQVFLILFFIKILACAINFASFDDCRGEQAHTFPDDCQQFAYRTVSYIGYDKQRFVSPGHFKDMKQLGRMENACSRQRGNGISFAICT